MPNLNRVMLMGNLTRDPELRYTNSNMAVINFGLAINRRWRNQAGDQQEETVFVDCEAWGKQAETINQYLKKGRPVYLEGRLKLDQWEDKEGQKRSKLKVVVEGFQFIDARQGAAGEDSGHDGSDREHHGQSSRGGPRPSGQRPSSSPSPAPSPAPGPHEAMDEGSIPF